MSASAKLYEEVAAKLGSAGMFAVLSETEPERDAARQAVWVAIYGIADAFAADNPRFDRDRFIAACEFEVDK